MTRKKTQQPPLVVGASADYDVILSEIVGLLENARRISARAVNEFMTATYREGGRRIVEFEQGGQERRHTARNSSNAWPLI